MQATARCEYDSWASQAKDPAPSPVRVLVQTRTHLVPGEEWQRKMAGMRNTIARHILKTDFDMDKDRMEVYNDVFAAPGYRCFFLFDHASSPVSDGVADDDIPLLWYRWTGEELVSLDQVPPAEIRRRIKAEYPFTNRVHPPKTQADERATKEEHTSQRTEITPETRQQRRRELIRSRVRCQAYLFREAYDWLAKNPEQEVWLKDNVEPGAWKWYEKIKSKWYGGPPWAED